MEFPLTGVSGVYTLEEVVAGSLRDTRSTVLLLGSLGALALILTASLEFTACSLTALRAANSPNWEFASRLARQEQMC